MKSKTILTWAAALLGIAGATPAIATDLNGAGATFPYPIYSKWFFEFNKETKHQINYQSIGSGGGIRQFTEGTVDFGASDAPMTDEAIAKVPGGVLHLPTVMGAVVMAYNVPGVGKLKMTPALVADIALGKVKMWNDPRIAADNKGAKLPKLAINFAHRSDGSGTTGIFTDYLCKISPEWKTKVGQGTAVKWPTGVGGKGNEGVAGLIKQIPGTIGYVELAYAHQNKIEYATLANANGKWVDASLEATTAAAAGALANMPADYRVMITNAAGDDAYPICGFTWLLVHPAYADKEKGQTLVAFLKWAYSTGESMASSLDYAPLPPELIKKVEATIAQIKY